MISNKIIISGTGCSLADFLYNEISFDSSDFKKYLSKKPGDGGLSPGRLVFTEELEKFAGKPYQKIIKEIIVTRVPDAFNVGGPSLVSLIHASQMLERNTYSVKFFGIAGKDEIADKIFEIIRRTPLNIKNYVTTHLNVSPFTDVFSDPNYDNGQGERTFVNNIGAAWNYSQEQLTHEFFDSHIVCFGGTALVPQLHDNLTMLLHKAKNNNCITVVNTVYDFRNEKKNPAKPWPLVRGDENYSFVDVLIMDCEEALRISGRTTIDDAADFFASTKVSSFIITNGANELVSWSRGNLFKKSEIIKLPVSQLITDELRSNPAQKGDTTGCGDNFAGGIIASIAWQLKEREKGYFDLIEAISWGIASGGFSCFTVGGTYLELFPGEKRKAVQIIQSEYLKQIGY
ncbi:MAG: carbohydrate kinase family protein [Ignavibacteria bacterium]|nr:carbohydrate kinase family protein [Ignavibacteria bacterium]